MKKTISIALVLVSGMAPQMTYADYVFGTPVNLGPTVNSSSTEWGVSISADGLSLFFGSRRPGSLGPEDLYVTTRASTTESWGEPMNLGSPVNNSNWSQLPSISSDGLTLFFSGNYAGGWVDELWVATRATQEAPWDTPANLGQTVNSSSADWFPCISADGLELVFCSNRSGGYGGDDLWVTTRETTDGQWAPPANLGPTVNSSYKERSVCISSDGCLLIFGSNRPGGSGGYDLWAARRAAKGEPWSTPVNLGPTVNSSAMYDQTPSLSADGSTLYFTSERPGDLGGGDIYEVSIVPILDLNGDGIVDGTELRIMVDHWGEDFTLCDIGPMPWGDGIVDFDDLTVLAENIGKEVADPTLIAHWALDEGEGDIAYDSARDNDGVVMGTSAWQPDDGRMDGALAFDGATFVVADSALNPKEGPFSVLAWVKGGAPGQAIISQQAGANWVMLDPATGALMTELRSDGRQSKVLYSDVMVSDGNWHCVGFTWDGTNRRLYVNDILVAEDTDIALAACDGGVNIGCGAVMTPDTFFTGLIDDVRMYNRAVRP